MLRSSPLCCPRRGTRVQHGCELLQVTCPSVTHSLSWMTYRCSASHLTSDESESLASKRNDSRATRYQPTSWSDETTLPKRLVDCSDPDRPVHRSAS
ncbi:hypothetical protein C2E23DRAFT_822762 [Lenzites betulinus]|nr:hypothetical protein C2E23DRAFT_822762 [Lenzites betulinus]